MKQDYSDKIISEGLTFDDILLKPGYSDFNRDNIELSTIITKNLKLSAPFISAPMDTVTEHALAIALAQYGGLGIIHRNLSIDNQAKEVALVHDKKLLVGGAVGYSSGFLDRVKQLVNAGVSLIVLDSAHGACVHQVNALLAVKKAYPRIPVMAGNIATAEGAEVLIKAGADCLRVGMGPGAICTTRIISGMGVPQITAILDTVSVAKKYKIPVIADGGIKYSGDIVKALTAGANAVMMGSYFASCVESPGETIVLEKHQVPHRFQSIFTKDVTKFTFKTYRGMGSVGAMQKGAKIKSEDEYHGKNYKDKVLVAEGVEGLVPVKGTVKQLLDQAVGGIKSGMYYVGVKSIAELQKKSRFIRITNASLIESHPHDILVTNPGENY